MDLKNFIDTPPWEWPEGVDKILLKALRDDQADESERLLAAELAGDSTVINEELAGELLDIVSDDKDSDSLRARAAISLGSALEYAFIDGFEDPEDVPISENKFHEMQESLYNLYLDTNVPKEVRRRILEALETENQDIHYEAVCAAGNWEVDAAWSHITGLITTEETDKYLLLAAIEAAASIRPQEAAES
jgi:uncharacterized protein (UPF0147 family)